MIVNFRGAFEVTGEFIAIIKQLKSVADRGLFPEAHQKLRDHVIDARVKGAWLRFFVRPEFPTIIKACNPIDYCHFEIDLSHDCGDLEMWEDFLLWVSTGRGHGMTYNGALALYPLVGAGSIHPIRLIYNISGRRVNKRPEQLSLVLKPLYPENQVAAGPGLVSIQVLNRRMRLYDWLAEHPKSTVVDIARGIWVLPDTNGFATIKSDLTALMDVGAVVSKEVRNSDVSENGRRVSYSSVYSVSNQSRGTVVRMIRSGRLGE